MPVLSARDILMKFKGGPGAAQDSPAGNNQSVFLPDLINASEDLTVLADAIVQHRSMGQFSMCLYGAPGTGKTEWVRHLASRLGMRIRVCRCSELLSMHVGQTEKAIANEFHTAKEEGSFLVFDEADSLLRDRRHAERIWEITQCNEFLTWMENHPGPLACTTNFMEAMDIASLRRFTFKVRLDYLKADQVRRAFEHFFKLEAPRDLDDVQCLAPGDFAVVQRKARFLGMERSPADLARMLMEEAEAKQKGEPRHQVGFTLSK